MKIESQFVRWKQRDALALRNGVIEAIVLQGGGHFAALRFTSANRPKCNALWEAPWATADPGSAKFSTLSGEYGGVPAGPFLAAFTGHAICLDYFGPPEKGDEAQGATLHGEAAVQNWQIVPTNTGCTMEVILPRANLQLSRSISLATGGSALLIEEQVENRNATPRAIHWVQHLTLGPPFLERGEAFVQASVDSCRSWPFGYEGAATLHDNVEFPWPKAPTRNGSFIDLRTAFERRGKGYVVAARVSQASPLAFIAACNLRIGIMLVYCFRREDFPWIAVWEENAARKGAPWNGKAQARGMEFGTTPMPLGLEAMRRMGQLFHTPVERSLPAEGRYAARYAVCLADISADVRTLEHVSVVNDALKLKFMEKMTDLEIPVPEARQFFGMPPM